MPIDPLTGTGLTSHMFKVVIEGVFEGGAHAITATDNVSEVVEHAGGESGQTSHSPGLHQTGECSITKDWTCTDEFLKWYSTVLAGQVKYTTVTVIRYETSALGVKALNETTYQRCFPHKWDGPTLNALNSAHATETIHFTWEHHNFKTY